MVIDDVVKRIAVVEDNPYDAELVKRVLERSFPSVNIIHFGDGISILRFADEFRANHPRRQCPFNAIFLDLKMPQLDGFEVLKRLRNNNQFQFTPVVVLTSSKEMNDIKQSYQLGANSYVVKPITPDSFKETIIELGKYWLSINQTEIY